ncbi:MAG: hypothetical protein RR948_14500 [Clostridium sp.]|uniref:hypothetical protein n=1 Tax=Clostridium sp. TaxID=1506 RepID=UPI0030520D13
MKNKSLLSILAAALILTGCSSNKIVESKMSRTELQNFPSHISEELDKNLTIDAETLVFDAENYNVLNVKYKQYDETEASNIFLKDEIIDTRTENGKDNDKNVWIKTKSNKNLSVSKYNLRFDVDNKDYTHLMFESNQYLFNEMKLKFPKDTLESLNKKDSIDKVKQVAKDLDLSLYDEPIVYSLDVNSLRDAENNFMTDEQYADSEATKPGTGKVNWTEEDEAYLIIFKSTLNNIPIYSRAVRLSSDNSFLSPNHLKAVVNKNGIVLFDVSSIYDSPSLSTENLSCIQYTEALKTIKNKYKNIIITDPIKISNINLEYIPRLKDKDLGEFILTPAWVFLTEYEYIIDDVISNSKIVIKDTDAILIDAITGKEIK